MRSFIRWIHSLAYVVKGARAMRKGDDDGVIRNYSRAIEISPEDLDYYYARGHAHWHKRELGLAVADFSKAIELNPKHFAALKNLAVLYEKAGFKHRAVEMWERCVHAAPDADTRLQIKEHLIRLL